MNWLLRKWVWAREKPLFWANLLLAALVVVVVFIVPARDASDFRVRALGMGLQLLGVLTVWRDLTTTARHFGKAGFLRGTWQWLKAGVFGRNVTISASLSGAVAMGMRARAKLRAATNPAASIADRVEALERRTMQIDDDLDKAYQEIDKVSSKLDSKVAAEADARGKAIDEVKRSLESAVTGNFSKLAFGAFWLGVGVILATLSTEISLAAAGRWAELLNRV